MAEMGRLRALLALLLRGERRMAPRDPVAADIVRRQAQVARLIQLRADAAAAQRRLGR